VALASLVDTRRVVTLQTARLTLRPFEAGDMQAVLAYRNDPAVSRLQGWPLPFTEADFTRLLDTKGSPTEAGWVSWCICAATNVIGDIGLRRHDEAEVGISLAAGAQSKGYASEALAGLSAYAFGELGAQRLHAGVDPANAPVIRLLTRAGWQHESTAVGAYWHRDHWADDAIYALSRTAWEQRPTP